jgi:vesicular inhibitory amino acid transporter
LEQTLLSSDSERLAFEESPLKARALRTALGLGALAAAAKVPFFAVVMSLIGSFLTLTVSVIFPAACHLKVFEDELTDFEKRTDWAIMIVGGFCVVAGSASAVADLLAK